MPRIYWLNHGIRNTVCAGSNRRHNRDRRPYERYMRETHGSGIVAETNGLRMIPEKVADSNLCDLLRHYKSMD